MRRPCAAEGAWSPPNRPPPPRPVATTFALGVARPQSCGIGGGGFLVYRGADGETAALDFRETAPAAVMPEIFAGQGLHKTFTGHTTVGVPGTVAGMQAALDSYGTISLNEAITPAERLAREGFEVPESLSEEMGNHVSRLRLFPETREQFLVGGEEPYPEGSILVQPDLADTLALIARQGPDAFYEGETADRVVEDMQNAGS
jgi:gamma-glutamyltranspeptidase/glutathione hydrolase